MAITHLDHAKGEPCEVCKAEAAAKQQAQAVADSMKAPKPGFLSPANQELVRETERFITTRIKGTNITISRRKK